MPGFYIGPGYPFIWLLHAWASDTLLSELYPCLLIQLSSSSHCFYTCEVKWSWSGGAGGNHSCLDYRNLGHHVLILVDLSEWPHPYSCNKQSLLVSLRPPSPPLPDPSSRGPSGYFLLMRMEMHSPLIQYGRDVSVTHSHPQKKLKKLQALTCNPLGYKWGVPTCNLSLWLLCLSVILTPNVMKRLRWQCK